MARTPALGRLFSFVLESLIVRALTLWSYSRNCKNTHGVIRKYGLMVCRRCFRENAANIGFKKVGPLTLSPFSSLLSSSLLFPPLSLSTLPGWGIYGVVWVS